MIIRRPFQKLKFTASTGFIDLQSRIFSSVRPSPHRTHLNEERMLKTGAQEAYHDKKSKDTMYMAV